MATGKANAEDLRKLFSAIKEENPDLTPTYMLALLAVFLHKGISMGEMAEAAGCDPSMVTKIVKKLGMGEHNGVAGLKFLDSERNPENDREKLVVIKPAGSRFILRLLELL